MGSVPIPPKYRGGQEKELSESKKRTNPAEKRTSSFGQSKRVDQALIPGGLIRLEAGCQRQASAGCLLIKKGNPRQELPGDPGKGGKEAR